MLANQSAADVIATALRSEIILGKILPGFALRQEELAARFSVSRIPVREALRLLEREGLVQVYPNRGAFVVRLSSDEIREITEIRILIEGDLIFQAVANFQDSDIRAVKEAERRARQSSATPKWVEGDRAFHRALYLPAQRPRQLTIALSLRAELERYECIYARLPRHREQWLKDHQAIIDACLSRDRHAARGALKKHLNDAGSFLAEENEKSQLKTWIS